MRDLDGNIVDEEIIHLDCGNWAEFDEGSGCSYRCLTCGATVGSISEPAQCVAIRREKEAKIKMWKVLST